MKILRTALWLLVFTLFLVRPVAAQTITNILKLYQNGAQSPISSTPLPSTDITCNTTALPASVVNPIGFQWDDPTAVGKVCIYRPGTATSGPIVPLPSPGIYEATVATITAAGTSPDSARAPFSKALPPAAPTGLAPIR